MPLASDANNWPFGKTRKPTNDNEILMLKDIYSLGICILELMIGRVSENRYSISIDSLPLTWAELPESTPLIQVIVECINIDSITQRKGKLATIKKLLIKEYKRFFKRDYYKMEQPFVTQKPDVLNKKGVFAYLKGDEENAVQLWDKSQVRYAILNKMIYEWITAQISDEELMSQLQAQRIQEKEKSHILEGILKLAMGFKNEGMTVLKKGLFEEKKGSELRDEEYEKYKEKLKKCF